jgi:hypothetical protein
LTQIPEDIYTEPSEFDVDTLRKIVLRPAFADAKEFELIATHESECFGIRSAPFLGYAFKTVELRIKVTINADRTWSYDEDTVLIIRGKPEPLHHTDRNTLSKTGEPTSNPLAKSPDIELDGYGTRASRSSR